ncbi:amino acid ABC transporter permease [Caballeronia cordobensis]|uniref:amino acid ABC transporter permease n=1 Tax=Caballeronia cordobensis TaxID=1353886 RepID=UPI00045EEAB1|nr:polar amino acid ABC transporter, inner membrane subunit [Burkholderia sp. RPE67]
MSYVWNWKVFLQLSLDGHPYYELLASGLMWTIATSVCAWLLAFVVGSIVGVMRTLPNAVARGFATSYVEVFRNVPLLMQIFLWYFVVPEFLPASVASYVKTADNGPFFTAVLAIGFFMSSRVAEQVRTGVGALPRGQFMAGTALGLTRAQTYRHILLPVAYRVVLPPMTSDFMATIKNTSVAMTIGLMELTGQARAMQEFTFQVFEAFSVAALTYLILNLAVTWLMRSLEKRLAVPGFIVVR